MRNVGWGVYDGIGFDDLVGDCDVGCGDVFVVLVVFGGYWYVVIVKLGLVCVVLYCCGGVVCIGCVVGGLVCGDWWLV